MIRIFLYISLLLLLPLNCSLDHLTGGSTDTELGNSVVGSIYSDLLIPSSNTQVTLITSTYNPITDDPIPDSLIDTTNELGEYILPVPDTSLEYNIQATHLANGTQALLTNIRIYDDTSFAPDGFLKKPGTVEVYFPDTVEIDTMGGYIYLPGTTIAKSLKNAFITHDNNFFIILDSVPQASFSTVYYIKKNDTINPIFLTDSFKVLAEDTVCIGDTVIWTHYTKQNSGLPDNEIFDIHIEANGAIWFATDGSGVASLINHTWTVYDRKNSDLPDDDVTAIEQDHTGTLWFSTDEGVVSFQQGQMTLYTSNNSPLPSNEVTNIDLDHAGTIWFSVFDGGIAGFDGSNWEIYDQSDIVELDDVFDLAIDQGDTIWIGTDKGLVKKIDTLFEVFTKDNAGLVSDSILCVSIDHNDNKWFGQLDGIVRLSDQTGEWQYFNHSHSQILNGPTQVIQENHLGDLYVGTVKGLTVYKQQKWEDFTGKRWAFLKGKEVTAIAFDGFDNIWLGTASSGVIVCKP